MKSKIWIWCSKHWKSSKWKRIQFEWKLSRSRSILRKLKIRRNWNKIRHCKTRKQQLIQISKKGHYQRKVRQIRGPNQTMKVQKTTKINRNQNLRRKRLKWQNWLKTLCLIYMKKRLIKLDISLNLGSLSNLPVTKLNWIIWKRWRNFWLAELV